MRRLSTGYKCRRAYIHIEWKLMVSLVLAMLLILAPCITVLAADEVEEVIQQVGNANMSDVIMDSGPLFSDLLDIDAMAYSCEGDSAVGECAIVALGPATADEIQVVVENIAVEYRQTTQIEGCEVREYSDDEVVGVTVILKEYFILVAVNSPSQMEYAKSMMQQVINGIGSEGLLGQEVPIIIDEPIDSDEADVSIDVDENTPNDPIEEPLSEEILPEQDYQSEENGDVWTDDTIEEDNHTKEDTEKGIIDIAQAQDEIRDGINHFGELDNVFEHPHTTDTVAGVGSVGNIPGPSNATEAAVGVIVPGVIATTLGALSAIGGALPPAGGSPLSGMGGTSTSGINPAADTGSGSPYQSNTSETSATMQATAGKRKEDEYNAEGFDKEGYNKEGYNKEGYNREGYDKNGYNEKGYDHDGYNKQGFSEDGFDRDGYDLEGFDFKGYNRSGYDPWGYDRQGYGRDGYHWSGYDADGYDRNGRHWTGYQKPTGGMFDVDTSVDANANTPYTTAKVIITHSVSTPGTGGNYDDGVIDSVNPIEPTMPTEPPLGKPYPKTAEKYGLHKWTDDTKPETSPVEDATPAQPQTPAPSVDDATPAQPQTPAPSVDDATPAQPQTSEPPVDDVAPSQPQTPEPSVDDATPAQPQTSEPPVDDVAPSQPQTSEPPVDDVAPSQPQTPEPPADDVAPSQPQTPEQPADDVAFAQPKPPAPDNTQFSERMKELREKQRELEAEREKDNENTGIWSSLGGMLTNAGNEITETAYKIKDEVAITADTAGILMGETLRQLVDDREQAIDNLNQTTQKVMEKAIETYDKVGEIKDSLVDTAKRVYDNPWLITDKAKELASDVWNAVTDPEKIKDFVMDNIGLKDFMNSWDPNVPLLDRISSANAGSTKLVLTLSNFLAPGAGAAGLADDAARGVGKAAQKVGGLADDAVRGVGKAAKKVGGLTDDAARGVGVTKPSLPVNSGSAYLDKGVMTDIPGVTQSSQKQIQRIVDDFGVSVKTRPTTPAAKKWLDANKAVPKPMEIKAKTLKPIDELIGGPKDCEGLVGYFKPKMPSDKVMKNLSPEMQNSIMKRYCARMDEYNNLSCKMQKYKSTGEYEVIDGVVFNDRGMRLTGDVDLYDITSFDGKKLPANVKQQVLDQLTSKKHQKISNIMHEDVISWEEGGICFNQKAKDSMMRAAADETEGLISFNPLNKPTKQLYNLAGGKK